MRNKKRLYGFLFLLVLLFAFPVSSQAAKPKFQLIGVKKPTAIVKGASYSIGGTVQSADVIREVRVTIYNSTKKKCLQRYVARPNSTVFQIAQADDHMVFGSLPIGQYYFNVRCKTDAGAKVVISKKFSIVGTGEISISNPLPLVDTSLAQGNPLSIGGTITSSNRIAGVTAAIFNDSSQVVCKKTVRPKTYSYTVGEKLDSAMQFDKLDAGDYKYKLTAVDDQGKSATLVYCQVTVVGSGQVTMASYGVSPQQADHYLDAAGSVTAPAGFAARTTRPDSANPYYYDRTYNIYYKYNSLAPTGKKYYGKKKNAHFVTGNCTWYACGRAMEIVAAAGGDINKVKAIFGGDPVGIYHANVTKGVFAYGTEPRVGALAIFNYGAGGEAHIAVVEDVVGNIPFVSESGYTVSKKKPNAEKSNIVFEYQSIYNWAGGRYLLGYIYLI